MNELQLKYLQILFEVKSLSICIVGQDRYPKGANGIAFCKDTLTEFFDSHCCGKTVLFSLGYSEKKIRDNYPDPKKLFFDLLENGIGFINLSYELLKDTSEEMFHMYQNYNEPFLKKADKIIILGISNTKPLFEKQYPNYKIRETIIHPSLTAKESSPNKWREKWETEYLKTIGN